MGWLTVGKLAVKSAKVGLKAYKKYKKNKDVIKSKEFLKAAKKTDHMHPGYVVAGKFAVKQSKKIARKQELKSLKAKLKNIWKQPD